MSTNLIPGLRFERYSSAQARGIRDTVESVYRRAYVDQIAMT
ncbi:hypothetical protein [Nocardia sp. NPDC006630]